ncbi:MAG TPA: biotin--[acetyl-CoA-carboxylase] ligase [Bacteroidia bacterium]|jgi:BirA family biotin operon repressor/biotin-[acetyl-CoA-carboxylase] ligase|nr:biotin--[acetyl-CoA-carboxylase] ligase [Bacteroidia bacterium]
MSTLFIGQNKVFLPETLSTNSYAIELLKKVNAIEGTVVYTYKQTQGKGQRGNGWIAEPQRNTTLSLILKPGFLNSKNIFYLSKITALALYDVLTEILNDSQFDIKIKWPNDILVNSKKIAGVLIENSILNEVVQWSVIGVGINVNQKDFGGINIATSLNLLSGKEYDLELIMELLFDHFEKWFLRLMKSDLKLIDDTYLKLLFKLDELSEFEQNNTRFKAKVVGVDESGLLVLEMENKSQKSFDIKDVQFIF